MNQEIFIHIMVTQWYRASLFSGNVKSTNYDEFSRSYLLIFFPEKGLP